MTDIAPGQFCGSRYIFGICTCYKATEKETETTYIVDWTKRIKNLPLRTSFQKKSVATDI